MIAKAVCWGKELFPPDISKRHSGTIIATDIRDLAMGTCYSCGPALSMCHVHDG
jgi:hypothetical protein